MSRFETRLVRPEGIGTWTFAPVPPAVVRTEGLRARLRVVGTIDGSPFRSTLMPRGGGALFIVVPRSVRERIGKEGGQSVRVDLVVDSRPEKVRVPKDLDRALGSARSTFDRLTPSHRKAFLQWIDSAKRVETRERRVTETVRMVRQGLNRN